MAIVGSLSNLLNMFAGERTTKLGAGESALKQVIDLFGAGSGTGGLRNELADVNENLISRGLGSTTRPAVASVGMKAKYEDIRKSRLAEALSALANFLGQTAPTAPTVSNLATSTNQALRAGPIQIRPSNTSGIKFGEWNDPRYSATAQSELQSRYYGGYGR